jgi:hypothetical protein
MMNGEELVQEVLDATQNAAVTADGALVLLNRAQVALAERLLLPGLSNGRASVATVVDDFQVTMPATYMKHLYGAFTDDGELEVYSNLTLMMADLGEPQVLAGPLDGVTVMARQLVYSKVPVTATTIRLWYYRKPVAIQELPTSFPDGVEHGSDVAELFCRALLYYATTIIKEKVESYQPSKPDTMRGDQRWEEFVALLRTGTGGLQVPRRPPPVCRSSW